MTSPAERSWIETNQAFLHEALKRLGSCLKNRQDGPALDAMLAKAQEVPTTAFAILCRVFSLSAFESKVLLLCAGTTLEPELGRVCKELRDDGMSHPTFGFAMSHLTDAHWSALTPASPLRRWRLVELGPGSLLTERMLSVDEFVLHYLIGLTYQEETILDARTLEAPAVLSGPHGEIAASAATKLGGSGTGGALVQIHGPDRSACRAVAAETCRLAGLSAYLLTNPEAWRQPGRREFLIRWDRYASLHGAALVVDLGEGAQGEELAVFLHEAVGPTVILGDFDPLWHRPVSQFNLGVLSNEDRKELWRHGLQNVASALNGDLDRLSRSRCFDVATIAATCTEIREATATSFQGSAGDIVKRVMARRSEQTRRKLGRFAQSVAAGASFEDLILPSKQLATLRHIASHFRGREQVHGEWGFASKYKRGLGTTVLFSGASGTGKTMAAEVLAGALDLELYRIDLSSVISKYVGETEKNLSQIFDAAEGRGVMLLFDEADALFGKRSEVRDSHDRYANIEVSYLLQRMEAYEGLAILTTNMRDALDSAFQRRICFIVDFPFPDASQRTQIWARVFPQSTPVHDLDFNKLARLRITGGTIRNIAMNAAFLAAEGGEAVSMGHLLHASELEYAKLEKSLSQSDTRGWVAEQAVHAAS